MTGTSKGHASCCILDVTTRAKSNAQHPPRKTRGVQLQDIFRSSVFEQTRASPYAIANSLPCV
jgi:hypothetical protein